MSGRLPSLNRSQTLDLFQHFAPACEIEGSIVTGVGRKGTFTVHLQHNGGLRSDQLKRTLGYLGVSRDAFWAWHDKH